MKLFQRRIITTMEYHGNSYQNYNVIILLSTIKTEIVIDLK